MTLRAFLNAGYATMVDEFQRIGQDLLTAIDEANKAFGLPAISEGPSVVEAQNAQALAQLQAELKGVRR